MELHGSLGLIIGIALGCSMWAAGIAHGKQRSMLLFGAIGFLFGLVGVLIAFVMSPREPERPAYTPFRYSSDA